jgi:hypothetical protein
MMDEFEERYMALSDEAKAEGYLVGIYSRVPEHARKLSLIMAVSRTVTEDGARALPDSIEGADVEFATGLLDWNVPRFVRMVEENVAYNPQDALKRRILAAVRRRGLLPFAHAIRLARDCTFRQAEDALTLLEEGGEIRRAVVDGKAGWALAGKGK